MTPDQAADLAARTLAAIDDDTFRDTLGIDQRNRDADRERVASDLAGLRDHRPTGDSSECFCGFRLPCEDRDRYVDGLLRTAALYGVGPQTDDSAPPP